MKGIDVGVNFILPSDKFKHQFCVQFSIQIQLKSRI